MTTNTGAGRAGVAPSLERCRLCGTTLGDERERAEHIRQNHAPALQAAVAKLSLRAQQWTCRAIESSHHSAN
jgi:hypothetical protein